MIHDIPVARDSGTIDNAFYHLERILEENLVEFLGHQEVQNFLERSLLVKPTIEDIAEKEHYSHIDILSVVLRALVLERVPLARPGYPLLTTDISNPESLLNKLRNKSDAVSEFIVDRLPIVNLIERFSPVQIVGVLRALVRENFSIRDLRSVMEAMLEINGQIIGIPDRLLVITPPAARLSRFLVSPKEELCPEDYAEYETVGKLLF